MRLTLQPGEFAEASLLFVVAALSATVTALVIAFFVITRIPVRVAAEAHHTSSAAISASTKRHQVGVALM